MKRISLIFLTMLAVIGLLAWAPAIGTHRAHAQGGANLDASVDRDHLSMGETLKLTLSLSTSDIAMPQLDLPQLDDFRVVGNSQSLQTSLVNGSFSTSMTYIYELQPVRSGDLTIPGLSLDWNGQQLSTEPITVTVEQGSAPVNPAAPNGQLPVAPPQAPGMQPNAPTIQPGSGAQRKGTRDLFIETSTDKQTAYVGEPLRYTTRLYSSMMSFGQPEYVPPKFVGFWHPQKPDVRQYFANGSDGTYYDVTELTTWLFPTTPGQATIDPATVITPGGFFSRGEQVESDPLTVEVKPLPEGAPAGFTGAVGAFELKATPDRQSTPLGEPVTLKVELSGTGNWGTLGDVQWSEDPNWRVYQQASNSQSDFTSGQMSGSRSYDLLWTPLAEGTITLPAIAYSYFDPSTGQYETISTPAQMIEVTPGDPRLAAAQPQAPASTTASNDPSAAPAIKPTPAVLTAAAEPLAQQTGFLLLFLVPAGLVVGDLSLAARKRYLRTHAAELRRSQAFKLARRRLQKIPRRAENVQMLAATILLAYLEDQIQQPLSGLSHSALAQVLDNQHIPSELAQRVIATLFTGEASEYTPRQPASHAEVVASTLKLLEDLENNRS